MKRGIIAGASALLLFNGSVPQSHAAQTHKEFVLALLPTIGCTTAQDMADVVKAGFPVLGLPEREAVALGNYHQRLLFMQMESKGRCFRIGGNKIGMVDPPLNQQRQNLGMEILRLSGPIVAPDMFGPIFVPLFDWVPLPVPDGQAAFPSGKDAETDQ